MKERRSEHKEELEAERAVAASDGSPTGGEILLEEQALSAKYDLGPEVDRSAGDHLPWGYGEDGIHALVVDPEHLFLYWEVTDEGIERASRRLPEDDRPEPGLCLRIYEHSGRIFDGTNPHSTFDLRVNREQRQWFLDVPRPGSELTAEIGILSRAGIFARIARSLSVELPRRQRWPETAREWIEASPAPDGGIDVSPRVPPDPDPATATTPSADPPEPTSFEGAPPPVAELPAEPSERSAQSPRPEEAVAPNGSERGWRRRQPPWQGSGQGPS